MPGKHRLERPTYIDPATIIGEDLGWQDVPEWPDEYLERVQAAMQPTTLENANQPDLSGSATEQAVPSEAKHRALGAKPGEHISNAGDSLAQ